MDIRSITLLKRERKPNHCGLLGSHETPIRAGSTSDSKGIPKGTVSYIAMKQIQAIYREEGKLKDLTSNERLEQRQAIIKPLVDALFMYLKQNQANVSGSCKLQDAFKYALNQENTSRYSSQMAMYQSIIMQVSELSEVSV